MAVADGVVDEGEGELVRVDAPAVEVMLVHLVGMSAVGTTSRPDGAVYVERVNAVMDFIESRLGEELTLGELADAACFSSSHFHRVFAAMVGETPRQFVARRRVERAAALLRRQPERGITEIGSACGFATPSAFARSFKQACSMTPTEWRAGGSLWLMDSDQDKCRDRNRYSLVTDDVTLRPLDTAHPGIAGWTLECQGIRPARVTIENLPDVEVAYVRDTGQFQGSPEFFADLFARLAAWAESALVPIGVSDTFALYHDEPGLTDDVKLRVSACVPVPVSVSTSGFIGRTSIAGGRYAIARFELADTEYEKAWTALLAGWLPQSGYEPDDRPHYFERFPPSDGGGEHRLVDICLPVRPVRR